MSQNNSRKRTLSTQEADEEGFDAHIPSGNSSPSHNLPPSSPAPFDPYDDGEEPDIVDDDIDDIEERVNEVDLFDDNIRRDYLPDASQDKYASSEVDDGEYNELDISSRRKVDRALDARDRLIQQQKARGQAFLDEEEEEEEQELDQYGLPVQRRRVRTQYDEDFEMSEDEIDPLSEEISLDALADIKAPSIQEWIMEPAVSRSIARELKSFLTEFTNAEGKSVYGSKIRVLGEVNSESLEVDFADLAEAKPIISLFLSTCPEQILKIFDIIAMEAVLLHYPDYSNIHSDITVRIVNYFPNNYTLRELRESHLNTLIRVSGVVTRRTGVFPQLKYVKFDCLKCGQILGPYYQDSHTEVKVNYCPNCRSKNGFRVNNEKTIYRNYQRVSVQEAPGSIPAGRLPRKRDVILLADLVDAVQPGQHVEITGIYKNSYDGTLNAKNGFPVFATIIEANSIKVDGSGSTTEPSSNNTIGDKNRLELFTFTDEQEKQFRKLSNERGIIDKIINSVAPSIYGHRDIKTAVASSLFGGVAKDINGKHSIRGDINVLLIGDPGTAKSQILKYVEKTAHRAVYATGQGASGVGLTASVRKDPITNEWVLEGGALVLADKGTCIIDEFDKMHDRDRTSIHEAMEQQSISISKAGIVTTLKARCAVVAAANPIGGRYNSTIPLSDNVALTTPILSRFDVVCVVRDLVNPTDDERLAKFVIGSHMNSLDSKEADDEMKEMGENPEMEEDEELDGQRNDYYAKYGTIDQEFLIKYINFSKNINPKLNQMDTQKVTKLYADLRRESLATGSMAITIRHLEAVIRISEAFARMRLSEFVSQYDIDRAIKVAIGSFVGSQKLSVKNQLRRVFAKYLV
ncbi:MCM DNA helicase complex subunit [Saccharomycopsis crataegensis]|uniref:DNA replication licensing factor MCM2 n=1 Tax=Saccharomycopsis crataegensis TaxID=43959 RepID=A0AAV5QMQ6_9ASCO|nr:MCM DNA helicase complex subunit [Saccharomycopsis crataegensis]